MMYIKDFEVYEEECDCGDLGFNECRCRSLSFDDRVGVQAEFRSDHFQLGGGFGSNDFIHIVLGFAQLHKMLGDDVVYSDIISDLYSCINKMRAFGVNFDVVTNRLLNNLI